MRLLGFGFLWITVLVTLASCGAYDKVAVWYKYRRDFRVASARPAAYCPDPIAQDTAARDEAPEACLAARTPPFSSRTIRAERPSRPEAPVLASADWRHSLVRKHPLWAVAASGPEQEAPVPPDKKPYSKGAILGFVLTMLGLASIFLGFLSEVLFLGLLLLIPGAILSTIALFKIATHHKQRGLGLTLPGLVVGVYLAMFAGLIAVLGLVVLAGLF